MRTEQLIQAMAADTERAPAVEGRLALGLLAACGVVAGLFLLLAGPRPDFAEALGRLPVIVKQAFPPLLALGGFGAGLRLACPGMPVGRWALVLAAVPVLLAAAVVGALVSLPPDAWRAAMIGHSWGQCLVLVTLLSLPMLGAALWALRRGASTRPALTGAVAGLMSGGAAATIYAIDCTDDSPLFYAVWYVLAILVVAALGAALGRRVLRW